MEELVMKKCWSLLLVLFAMMLVCSGAVAEAADYVMDDDGTIIRYLGAAADLVVPGTVGDVTVTHVGDAAFSECNTLTSVTLP